MLKSITFYFFFISIISGFAQKLKFEHYNDNDGLSHNSVRHIVQDKKGFLWIGTFSGLNRFDGYEFKSYLSSSTENNTISNDDITALELDDESNILWVGSRKGLTRFQLDTHTFKTFLNEKDNPNSLPDEEIRAIHVDKFKRVWVGTRSSGLFIFYPEENRFSKVSVPGFNYVKEVFEDTKGNIWVGSTGTGSVAKITLDSKGNIVGLFKYTLSVPNSDEINPYLNFIYEDSKSEIFVGTRKGLYKLDASTNTFKNLYINDDTIRENFGPYFLSVAQAPDGKYWVGTLGGLLVCDQLEDIEKGKFEWYYSDLTNTTSLVDNLISSLYFDASGVLWIGTEDGLDKYDPYENQFKLNKDISKYLNNQVPRIRDFAKTFDGKKIVATWHNGLFISEGKDFVPLLNNNNDIASIYSWDGKIFYIGLWDGKLLVFNYLKNTSRIFDVGFNNSPIFTCLQYDENTLFVGSFGEGVHVLDVASLEPKNTEGTLLPDFEINKITKDEEILWFATEEGVISHDFITKKTKVYKHNLNNPDGLPHNNVSDVLIDLDKDIWVSTRGGMAKFTKEIDDFKLLNEPKELKGKWITDMVVDAAGDLWLNINNNSIAKYNTDQKSANLYHVKSGNRLDVFSSSGFFNFNDSLIYIAGKDGVIYFSPNNIKENKWSPKPLITEFKVQNREIFPGTKVDGRIPIEKGLNYNESVTLSHSNRNFSIQFSSPSFTNEQLNKFQYKLEGFDEDWIESESNSRTVQYTNLDSEDYIFKIKSKNSDGNWSEISSYNIIILPNFWGSYKGISLTLFILGLLIYFSRKQIKSRIKLKQELLTEKVKRERDEKLNNEKLRFFTNISHELRTPLTLILGPVKQLKEQDEANTYAKSRVDLIYHNANRLLRLVNQILDFRRAETGELKLKVSQVDILINTKNIFNSFIELSQTKNININLNVEDDQLKGYIDLDKFNKILYNLLSNAIKFSNNYGNVDLFLGFTDEPKRKLIVEVSDDGIGIPIESQERIFSRFYQANNSKDSTTGTGIGLSLVKALVDIHKGSIRVESEPEKGSVFTIELPVYIEAYSEDELCDFALVKEEKVEFKTTLELEHNLKSRSVKRNPKNTEIKQKVLVIEDNIELRKYIAEFLSEDYKVYEAENGQEGLEVCRKIKPVLCVVDVMMPVMDGFQFVEELKSDENLSHTAIVLLTALAENENRIKGYKIGVDGYMVKPFDPALLKTRIDNIIKIHFDLKQKFSSEADSDVITLAHSQIDIDFISKINELIEQNIANTELTSSFLCGELAMSSSKLYRKIKQLTDLSPNELIRTIRLKKSVLLLKSKNFNVSEVAHKVGFNDPLYFSRCFKKQFGHSPSKLIKKI